MLEAELRGAIDGLRRDSPVEEDEVLRFEVLDGSALSPGQRMLARDDGTAGIL